MKKIFKHNKTGNLYQLEQDHLLCKTDVKSERVYYADSFDVEFKDTYEWDKNKADQLVLYKALYENEDGPYFVRYRKDFDKSFVPIQHNLETNVEAVYDTYMHKDEVDGLFDTLCYGLIERIFSKKMWYEFFSKYKTNDSYLPKKTDNANFRFYVFDFSFPMEYLHVTNNDGTITTKILKFIKISWHHEMDTDGYSKGRTIHMSFDEVNNFINGDDDYQPLIDWMKEQKEMENDKQRQKDYELYLKLKKQFEE